MIKKTLLFFKNVLKLFRKKLKEVIKMNFNELESKRKSAAKSLRISIIFMILAFIIIIFLGDVGDVFVIIGIISAAIALIFGIKGGGEYNKLKLEFKNDFLSKMIEDIFDNGIYEAKQGLDKNIVYKANLLRVADRYSAEDYISGSVDGVNFCSSDIKLEEKHTEVTKDGTRTYYITYFLGRFFMFDFNKQFKGDVITTEASLPTFFSKYKRIELESIEYNKKFKTYTMSELEAFYVLTPQLMEAILKLEKSNPGAISFAFMGTKLYIAINNNRDTFELKLFKKIDEEELASMRRDLYTIIDIVKELRLNDKIFM